MFKYLMVQNFQAHQKLRIDFDPGITCIVGSSDVGKSAVLRALRWVCENQPGGAAFIRHDTKGAAVKLGTDEFTITRRRSATGDINTYALEDKEFKAFGRNVPEPITQCLNLGPVSWQNQHDAPYWFGETAGEVSRQLNAIVNLSVIDETLAGVARAVHQARTRLELAEEGLTEAKKENDALTWVPDFTAALCVIKAREKSYSEKVILSATASSLQETAIKYGKIQKNAANAAKLGSLMLKNGTQGLQLQNQVIVLQELISNAKKHQRATKEVIPNMGEMAQALDEHEKANTKSSALDKLIQSIKGQETNLCQLNKELKRAEAAMPNQCPTCGQSL